MKIYYPAADQTPDLLNQSQTCYNLSQRYVSAIKNVSPLQAVKAHGGCGCKDPHNHTATALGRHRVDSSTLDPLYPGDSPMYSFCRRLSGPQDQSGHVSADQVEKIDLAVPHAVW